MRILRICAKCSDLFTAKLERPNKKPITHSVYVPDFMPEHHYGDYVELDIDVDSGQIINWKVPTDKVLEQQLNGKGL